MRPARLLAGCALGAVVAAFSSGAAAQSFNGTPTTVAGNAAVFTSPGAPGVPPSTSVLVLDSETVINWATVDSLGSGAIDFQPAGTVALFSADPALTDYTVLNRILPITPGNAPTAATVAFNGTVQSLLGNNPGGQIWFFSPTGIILGPTAVFNVGSLILTTDDIQFTPGVSPPAFGGIYGPGGLVQFVGPAGSAGSVQIQPGAQINATGIDAYVALVAPRVVQGGAVQADGNIAYIAAEQLDMTINGGLFDFAVTVGTTHGTGIEHTGTTTGPASTSAADQQRISMVAVPKATALTMLLSGAIGYSPAAVAANEGSAVVLAAGFADDEPTALPAARLGSIELGNATFSNALTAYATDDLTIAPAGGTTAFQAGADLFALDAIALTAGAGEQVTAAGDLLLHAGEPGAGGTIAIQALGKGGVSISGALLADASSGAAQYVALPTFLDAAGGDIAILADDGTISAASILADAGATGAFGDSRGGIGTGGTADLSILNGGGIATGTLTLAANAVGGPSTRNGGDGTGGTAGLTLGAGTLTVGSVFVESNGVGGGASASAVAAPYQSGHGVGGSSTFTQNGGTATVTNLSLESTAFGGGGGAAAAGTELAALAGNGTGGTARLALNGGALVTTTTTISALGDGGDGMDHDGAGVATDGGVGTGGTAALQSAASWTGSFAASTLAVQANGEGGDAGSAATGTGGTGGNGIGANASVDLADGAFTLGAVTVGASGGGGPGANGGEGAGGQARFAVVDTAGPTGARSIASLTAGANGQGDGTAASDAGAVALTARVLDAASALSFAGDLALSSVGSRAAAGPGITVSIGGAPLTIGGAIDLTTAREVLVDADQPLRTLGHIAVASRGFTSTGLVDADGTLSVAGTDGIFAERLESGGTTLLQAVNGPLVVSADLASVGDVTALGRSVDLTALGALSLASAQATAGNLRVVAAGDLTAAFTQATGAATLDSGAAFVATGPLTSGGAMSLLGNTGLSAGTVASGGATSLRSPNGAVFVGDLSSLGEVTALGRSVEIQSPGSLSFADLGATAGDALVRAQGDLAVAAANATGSLQLSTATGDVTAGDLAAGTWAYIEAAGSASLGNLTAGADAAASAFGGDLAVGNVTAGDEIWLSVFGADPARVLTAGDLVSTGLGDDAGASSGVLFGSYPNSAGPTGNVTRVRSAGSLVLGDVRTPGRAILVADAGTTAAGSIDADEAAIVLGRGDIALAGATSGGRFYVADSAMFLPNLPDDYDPASLDGLDPVSTSGGLTVAGAVAAGTVTVAVGGDAALAGVTSAGATALQSGGALTVDDLLSTDQVIARGGSVDIASSGALSFADLDATSGSLAVQTAGNLTLATTDGAGAVALGSTGAGILATGTVTGGAVQLTAADGIQADTGLVSAGALGIDAGGTFTLAGVARGSAVGVRAADVVLGGAATVGARGLTQTVTMTNADATRTMFLGGAANPAGYSLDGAEAGRVFAEASITLASPGNVTMGDLALGFGTGANIGTGGQLKITSPATVSIVGEVALTTTGAGDSLLIDPQLVRLDTDTGSVALLDAGGAPLGRLGVTGDTIAIATGAVLDQLGAAPGMAAINALLDQPGGGAEPLAAGSLELSVGAGLFIQNTGASQPLRDRRGFTAGGVNIVTASPATRIVVNGQIVTPGGPLTGLDTQTLVRINGMPAAAGGPFDPASTINGCVIGGRCAPPPGTTPPTDTDLVGPVPPGQVTGSPLAAPLIELAESEPLIDPPLVDEPITGVGNDDLWQPRCEDAEIEEGDETCREADERP